MSGHKSEHTIKQYARRLSAKKKRELSGTLSSIINAKEAKLETPEKLAVKAPTATVSKPPDVENSAPENPNPPAKNQPEFEFEALDNAPPDDVLIQFLSQFDQPANLPNAPPNVPLPAPVPVQAPQPLQPNHTMNIQQNVKNVQNMQNVPRMPPPAMYFGGNSTVTINYNFGPNTN